MATFEESVTRGVLCCNVDMCNIVSHAVCCIVLGCVVMLTCVILSHKLCVVLCYILCCVVL